VPFARTNPVRRDALRYRAPMRYLLVLLALLAVDLRVVRAGGA
jgi:hypothetical protein